MTETAGGYSDDGFFSQGIEGSGYLMPEAGKKMAKKAES